MSARDLHGLIAEFETPEALARAVEAARMAGYTQLEAFSPFPLRNVAEMLGARPAAVPCPAELQDVPFVVRVAQRVPDGAVAGLW